MAEDIKSLDQLKDAVTANAGGVLGSSSAEAQSLSAAPREPQRDAQGRAYATGKRKDAVARVWVKPGSGKVTVNGKDMSEYFARPVLQMILRQPFDIAGVAGQYDVYATVAGGGLSGQAGAVKHGISKALQLYDPALRPALKAGGQVIVVDADRPTGAHGTPPALLRCELSAVGYRETGFARLKDGLSYVAVFEAPAPEARPAPAAIRSCRDEATRAGKRPR